MVDAQEFKRIRIALVKAGWRVEMGGAHWKGFPPDKSKPMVVWSCTASDWRTLKNLKAQIRRSDPNIKI